MEIYCPNKLLFFLGPALKKLSNILLGIVVTGIVILPFASALLKGVAAKTIDEFLNNSSFTLPDLMIIAIMAILFSGFLSNLSSKIEISDEGEEIHVRYLSKKKSSEFHQTQDLTGYKVDLFWPANRLKLIDKEGKESILPYVFNKNKFQAMTSFIENTCHLHEIKDNAPLQ